MWFSRKHAVDLVITPSGVAGKHFNLISDALHADGAMEYDCYTAITHAAHVLDKLAHPSKAGRVMLSQHWFRFLNIPWSDDLLSSETASPYLGMHFEATFGEDAQDWRLVANDVNRGQPVFVCACKQQTIEMLSKTFADRGMKLLSAQAWSITAFNRLRHLLPGDAYVAAIEPKVLALFDLANGRLQHASLHTWSDQWPESLSRIISRHTLRQGTRPPHKIYVMDMTGHTDRLPDTFQRLPDIAHRAVPTPWPHTLLEALQ